MAANAPAELADFLVTLVTPLVAQPEAIRVNSRAVEGGVQITFRVAPDETGRIIGRGGETIRAIRTIMTEAADRSGLRLQLDLPDA